jgi:hypothetical protein
LPLTLDTARPGDAEVDIEVLSSVPKEFCIDSEERANWLVRKIVAARDYSERVKTWCEQEQRRAIREEQTLMFLFGRQIEAWARDEIVELHKRKSLALPAGCVGFRTVASKLVIHDERLVLGWAKQACPQVIVIVEKLSKAALDHYVEKTGDVPDSGIHIEPEAERFYIK